MKRKNSFKDSRPWYRRIGKGAVIALNMLVALLMLLGGLSVWINPQTVAFPAYLGLFFPVLVLLNVLFIVFWLFLRDYWAVLSLVMMLLVGGQVVNTFACNFSDAAKNVSEAPVLTMMSYNTMSCGQFAKATKEKGNPVLDDIVKENPDVVCMQEFAVSKYKEYLQMADVKRVLKAYPYSHIEFTIDNKYKKMGIATFSKFPIIRKSNLDIASSFNMAICSDIVVRGDTVRIFNCHLESNKLTEGDVKMQSDLMKDFDTKRAGDYAELVSKKLAEAYSFRASQAQQISAALEECTYPVLLCGDFNDVPVSYTYQTIKGKRLKDAFIENGFGFGLTFQKNLMNVRIDYIMHDDNFVAGDFQVGKTKYSDHYPIKCTIYRAEKHS
ncbi:MAG: endonuclease/exonuclease/phosphatase family protein [Bacteroidetes bacterium]|uniref:Endonuclease/exonuclease/phosphatase family protein n=1 Tax=Candidatus Gallipaludibacter merdavium TaxID=2840839 RepID=A0A9D9N561_9BACT|nr:endonuclease/exonuclease/phosphatase family protein [Candidatus Gallipaludibacter merdavium]